MQSSVCVDLASVLNPPASYHIFTCLHGGLSKTIFIIYKKTGILPIIASVEAIEFSPAIYRWDFDIRK
jgi:hypothetical protein